MTQAELERGIVRRIVAHTSYLTGVVLQVTEAVAARYTLPGQVLAFRPASGEGDKPLYIALASSPGEARAFEVLLGPAAAERLEVTEGATWTFEGPFGKGYPVDAARGKDVLLFAVGSGLAALRPVVQAIRAEREAFGRVTLYVGAHTPHDFPYADELRVWPADGIEVRRAISKPWVQEVFRADPPPVDNAFAFVCGMSPMVTAVGQALVEAGLPPDAIGKNW